jgi:hypothetical protein
LSIRLAEWALATHRADEAATYAADAATTSDGELRKRARKLADDAEVLRRELR